MFEIINQLGITPHPYGDKMSIEYVFSVIMLQAKVLEDTNIPTACIGIEQNKPVIRINPDFIDQYSKNMNDVQKTAFIRGIVKHELLHYMLKHLAHPANYNPKLANIVQDALINTVIPEFYKLIADGVINAVTPEQSLQGTPGDILIASNEALREDWTWEEYYKHLMQKLNVVTVCICSESDSDKQEQDDNSKNGQSKSRITIKVKHTGDIKHGEIPEDQEVQINEMLGKLIDSMKQAGTLPGWLDRVFSVQNKNARMRSVLSVLSKTFRNGTKVEKVETHTRPNKRFPNMFGTRNVYKSVKVLVFVDVSGSVDDESLQKCIDHLYALSRAYGSNMHIFTYDTKIQSHVTYSEFKRNGLKTKGGGGTSLSSALEEIDERFFRRSIVYIFTDGYDTCPKRSEFKDSAKIVYVLYKEHNDGFANYAKQYATVIYLP